MIENPELETPNPEPQTSLTQPIAADLKAPEFGSSLDDEPIAAEIFNGEETLQAIEGLGEIPEESRKGLSQKSFVLDTLLNFFSSEKESPDRMENTLEGTIGGSINDQVDVNSQPKVEDTTGFKMPDSLEGQVKGLNEPSSSTAFTNLGEMRKKVFSKEDSKGENYHVWSSVEEDTVSLDSKRGTPNRGKLRPDIKNKVSKITKLGNGEDKYEDIISIVEAVKVDDTKFKDLNDRKLTATNGMTAERVNELLGTTYGLGDTLSKADYDATFEDYKAKIITKIKSFEVTTKFSKNQKLALFMLLYNGGGNLKAPEGIKALKAGNFEMAAHELFSEADGITSKTVINRITGKKEKVTVPGLLKRRIIERTLFETKDKK